jgi:hypothetical protein
LEGPSACGRWRIRAWFWLPLFSVKDEKGFVKNFSVKDIATNQRDQSFQEFEMSTVFSLDNMGSVVTQCEGLKHAPPKTDVRVVPTQCDISTAAAANKRHHDARGLLSSSFTRSMFFGAIRSSFIAFRNVLS